MTLTNAEFDAILNDETKYIEDDIRWSEDEDHSPSVVFRAEVRNDAGWPLLIAGSHNPLIPRTSFHLIHRHAGRIYGLDHGKQHQNPDGSFAGEKHKHKWDETTRDKAAYEPDDITASASEVRDVWEQFCHEARIVHRGQMQAPPPHQGELYE